MGKIKLKFVINVEMGFLNCVRCFFVEGTRKWGFRRPARGAYAFRATYIRILVCTRVYLHFVAHFGSILLERYPVPNC